MKYRIYEHVIGLPSFLDTIREDLEEIFEENHYSAEEVEKEIKKIMQLNPFDKYGRKINLYTWRCER